MAVTLWSCLRPFETPCFQGFAKGGEKTALRPEALGFFVLLKGGDCSKEGESSYSVARPDAGYLSWFDDPRRGAPADPEPADSPGLDSLEQEGWAGDKT